MTSEEILNRLREHDLSVVELAASAPTDLVAALEKALPALDGEARELAVEVLVRHNGSGVGQLLLGITNDENAQVAAAAAQGLNKVTDKPLVGAIVSALHRQSDEYVRGQLYLAMGRMNGASSLDALRTLAHAEQDSDAALDAQAAIVKLGGQVERAAFVERVRVAEPDQATVIRDHLLYIDDPKLAKAMLPWLPNKDGVFRLGSDRNPGMIRMCDLAVWTAYLLHVRFVITPDHLTNFDEGVIANATAALRSLPD